MNNAERLIMEKNREREIARKEPFEILMERKMRIRGENEKVVKLMHKICEEIENEKMSYLEVNEALYRVDAALRERSLEIPLIFREEAR